MFLSENLTDSGIMTQGGWGMDCPGQYGFMEVFYAEAGEHTGGR